MSREVNIRGNDITARKRNALQLIGIFYEADCWVILQTRVLIEIKEINMCHVKVTLLPPMSFIILHITAESVMFVQSEKQKGLVI